MRVRFVYFIAILILGISLSVQNNDYRADKAAKKAWKQAREEGKAAKSNLILVINPDGKEIGRHGYSFSVVCKRGYTIDKVLDDVSTTCKKGPGNGKREKCVNVYGTISSISCPGYMYMNAFWDEGTAEKIRCCGKRNLKYSQDDCNVKLSAAGADFETSQGKFWTGFSTNDGGVNWNITECGYKSSYKY